LTREGRHLLDAVSEMTVKAPHEAELAQTFFDHLHAAAPKDWKGFGETLSALERGVRRADLVGALQRQHPEWTESVAATNAAGYVARSREWGLVAPRQVQGRYEITNFGRDLLKSHWEVSNDDR
jgi:hypothetical protein